MHRVRSGRVPDMKLPLSSLCGVGTHQLSNTKMYDSTCRTWAGKRAQGSAPIGFHYIGMGTIGHMIELNLQIPCHPIPVTLITHSSKPQASNHGIGLSEVASPHPELYCYYKLLCPSTKTHLSSGKFQDLEMSSEEPGTKTSHIHLVHKTLTETDHWTEVSFIFLSREIRLLLDKNVILIWSLYM